MHVYTVVLCIHDCIFKPLALRTNFDAACIYDAINNLHNLPSCMNSNSRAPRFFSKYVGEIQFVR